VSVRCEGAAPGQKRVAVRIRNLEPFILRGHGTSSSVCVSPLKCSFTITRLQVFSHTWVCADVVL